MSIATVTAKSGIAVEVIERATKALGQYRSFEDLYVQELSESIMRRFVWAARDNPGVGYKELKRIVVAGAKESGLLRDRKAWNAAMGRVGQVIMTDGLGFKPVQGGKRAKQKCRQHGGDRRNHSGPRRRAATPRAA